MKMHLFNKGYCEDGWDKDGLLCYTLFRQKSNGVMYAEAWQECSEVGAQLIMPKSVAVAKRISDIFDWLVIKIEISNSLP